MTRPQILYWEKVRDEEEVIRKQTLMGFRFLNKELVLYLVTNGRSPKDFSGGAVILGLFCHNVSNGLEQTECWIGHTHYEEVNT